MTERQLAAIEAEARRALAAARQPGRPSRRPDAAGRADRAGRHRLGAPRSRARRLRLPDRLAQDQRRRSGSSRRRPRASAGSRRGPATMPQRPAGIGRRPEPAQRRAALGAAAADLVVEPQRRVGAEQDLDDAHLVEQPGRLPAAGRPARGSRPGTSAGTRSSSGVGGGGEAQLGAGDAEAAGMARRLLQPLHAVVVSARPDAASALELGQDLPAHRVSRCRCRRTPTPSRGSRASAARRSGATGHLPSSASRSATSRRSAAASDARPRAAARPAARRSRACRRCAGAPAGRAPRPAPAAAGRDRRRAAARARPAARPTRASSSSSTDCSGLLAQRHGSAHRSSSRSSGRAGQGRDRPRRQLPDRRHQRRPQGQERGHRGQLLAQRRLAARRRPSWRLGDFGRGRPERGADLAHRPRPTSCCGLRRGHAAARRVAAGSAGADLLDQAAELAAREAAPARPGLARPHQQVLERQDQHAARASSAGAGAAAPAGRARASSSRSTGPRRSSVSIRPTTWSSCSSLAPDMSRSRAGRSECRAHALAARSSSARARLSITLSAGAPVLVQLDPTPPVEADVAAVDAGAAASRSFGSSIGSDGPDLLQRLALQRPLVPRNRLPQAADLTPAVQQPLRPGQACCACCSPTRSCQPRSSRSTSPSSSRARPAPRSASRTARSATPQHGRGVGGRGAGLARRPLPAATARSVRSRASIASLRDGIAVDRRPDRRRDLARWPRSARTGRRPGCPAVAPPWPDGP